jgi:hypothetical protein
MQRVYEIAREFHLTNKQVIDELQRGGYPVRSYATPVTDEELAKLRAAFAGRTAGQPASG